MQNTKNKILSNLKIKYFVCKSITILSVLKNIGIK